MRNIHKNKVKKVFLLLSIILLLLISLPMLMSGKKKKGVENIPVPELNPIESPVVYGEEKYSLYIDYEEYFCYLNMTWENWVDSEFNTLGLVIEDDYVVYNGGSLKHDEIYVIKSYYVVPNRLYEIYYPTGSVDPVETEPVSP